ncbi:MAG: PqqD family protein [Lachnospiraceae bacterium]|nr:PqqD family protein [Lachnospiraceae bacterium]
MRADHIKWSADEDGKVSLQIENRGVFNKIAQIVLNKPKVSYVHLEEMGSFIWPLLDGQKTILELGEEVEKEFGEKAQPLYERLAKYFQILESYGFVEWRM